MSILDSILDNHESRSNGGPRIISEQHDVSKINWVAGVSDPGEMIACGYLPELRRLGGEEDAAYQARITPMLHKLPQDLQKRLMGAAIQRASYDTSTGKVAFASAFKPAWSGLGVLVDGLMTWEQVYKLASLDFAVEKVQKSY